jgi:hypothetical protein
VSPTNRLARFLNAPDGITAEQATARAQARLSRIQESVERELAEAIDCLRGYLRLLHGDPPSAVRDELKRLTYALAANAGTFGRPELSKVARDLCELFDVLDQRGAWDRAAVDVHFDAMRLLLSQPPGQESDNLLEGLHRVTLQAGQS